MGTQGNTFLMPRHTALQSKLFSRWHTTPPVFHSENARKCGLDPSKLSAFAAPTAVAVLVTGYALCGRCQGLQKRLDVVRCQAGFEGSGLTGKWGCYKTEGDIDAYWKATGLPWLARKGLQLMDWGAGKNQNIREFLQDGDSIKMAYSFDGPGLGGLGFTETYTVGNGIQEISRMGGAKILVDPAWESDSVLRVQNMNPAKQTQGWAKTLLSGPFKIDILNPCVVCCCFCCLTCLILNVCRFILFSFLSGTCGTGGQDEETQKQMVDGETSKDKPLGDANCCIMTETDSP